MKGLTGIHDILGTDVTYAHFQALFYKVFPSKS